jgi:phosphatidylserine decarboxylase
VTHQPLRWYHRLFIGLHYLIPQHALAAVMYRLTRTRWQPFKDLMIRLVIRIYRVDMDQALEPDPRAYPTFNSFFTRALRPEARPPAAEPDAVLSPADGTLSQAGRIVDGRLFQAKGQEYSLDELLAGDADWTSHFQEGTFYTVYLSPRDYHRVHMPLRGTIKGMIHVPGKLFSVNDISVQLVPRLFTRNERVVCLFEGEAGPMAVILVGAIFVGSMETVWAGEVTPSPPAAGIRTWRYEQGEAVNLGKGEEMGRFNMGSTVILLFPAGAVTQDTGLAAGDPVQVGQRIGRVRAERRRGDAEPPKRNIPATP